MGKQPEKNGTSVSQSLKSALSLSEILETNSDLLGGLKLKQTNLNTTYWYGPFITKRSLKENMSSFIKDLSDEGSKNIKYSLVRCKKEEPLTV